MVLEALRALTDHLPPLNPREWKRPHFNFIACHYLYMLGWSITGSIILYPFLNLHYIDALFFSAGAATQSGLNTVDTNKLALYQQVTLMLMACVCNPIWINTAVVFVRLYWFEKRFEHMIAQAREDRKSKARTFTKTKSEGKGDEPDPQRLESGVGGRRIKVLHETVKPNGMSGSTAKTTEAEKEFAEKLGLDHHSMSVSPTPPGGSNRSSDNSDEVAPDEKVGAEAESDPETPSTPYLGLPSRLSRDITFADELPTPRNQHAQQSPKLTPLPEGVDVDKHIQFIERQQQNAKKEGGTLRIPGPRDFDRGEMPKELDDSDDELTRPQTRNTMGAASEISEIERGRQMSAANRSEDLNMDDHQPNRAITIAEPEHPGHRARRSEDTEQDGETSGGLLSRIKSGISHRRHHSGNLKSSNTRGSMARTFSNMTSRSNSKDRLEDTMPYLSWQATIGRNSAFLGLTQEQREELGGIEYRALKTLAKILIVYFVGFHLSGLVALLPWIMTNPAKEGMLRGIIPNNEDQNIHPGISPAWWGVFTPASMFNDLGFTLTPDSMISFQGSIWVMLYGSFLIIIGNTGFPVMLRFVIWVISKLVTRGSPLWDELRFLLDHPRRCFTLLFPSKATWWLFWVLVILNGVDLVFFIILDLHDTTVTSLSPGIRVLDGWFQATSTRTAGFACVDLADLHPAIQVSYLVMMYISVFPIAISVRRTNVYEEKSLGVWGGEEDVGEGEQSYVGQHLRRQLSFDLWYVFLGFFIICIVEGSRLAAQNGIDAYAFTMFAVLFEVVSAYGTVGLSLGYPTINASFSAEFKTLSKLVIVAMMIRGRHRGLPYALDRAVLLPSEKLHKKDDEAATLSGRRQSVFDEQGDWEDGDLDANGLPRQHSAGAADAAMTAGAGGEHSPEGMRRTLRRRSSGLTTASRASGREGQSQQQQPRRKHERRRSIGVQIMQGLNPGPTFSKYD